MEVKKDRRNEKKEYRKGEEKWTLTILIYKSYSTSSFFKGWRRNQKEDPLRKYLDTSRDFLVEGSSSKTGFRSGLNKKTYFLNLGPKD